MSRRIACIAVLIALACAGAGAQQLHPVPPSTGVQVYTNPGIVAGYVFWNASSLQYNGAPCKGMSVTVEKSAGVVVGTDNNLTASTAGPYEYCVYSVHNVPEANDLRIRIHTPPNAFPPDIGISTPPGAANQGYIKLPGATCNMLSLLQPSPAGLNAGWWACKDYAHNVNLMIYAATPAGGLPTHPFATPSLKVPSAGPVSSGGAAVAGTQRTLLPATGANASSQQMLLPANPSGATASSSGMLAPAVHPGSQPMTAPGNAGGPTPASTRTAVSAGSVTQLNSSPIGGPAPVPSKGTGTNKYEAVTAERGSTQDPGFTKWANSTPSSGRTNSSAVAVQTVPNAALVGAACAKDLSLRILGVVDLEGSAGPITFKPNHKYKILGCSFGPDNPDNAVYLSDGGLPGSAFTWYFKKLSWGNNSVVVLVSTAPSSPHSNLMLFVLGQNGNTELNGVSLSAQ